MFWLPKLAVNSADWRLPLAESTAATIVAVLFPVANKASRETFRRTVATDPGLALWLACKFPRDRIPTGIGDLAEWFLQDGVAHLAGNQVAGNQVAGNQVAGNFLAGNADVDQTVAPAQWDPGAWSDLVARSRYVAQRTAQLTRDSPRAHVAELIGLLHASPQLLALCGPPVQGATVQGADTDDSPSCLPGWLEAAIGQLGRADTSDEVYQSVRQAMEASVTAQPIIVPESATSFAALLPRLAETLARLATLEDAFAASVESAKLEAMRELAYGASHEINNPLANISTRAQTLLVGETDPERRRKLATINSQAFRAHEMISDIMLFAKPPQIDPSPVDLAELTDELFAELAEDAAEQGTELRRQGWEHRISVQADRGHLAVAFKALVRNSLEALGMGGQVELTARLRTTESISGSHVEIVVRDTGPGVSAEARSSIFNPFYSGREAGRGLGLGLSKCWRIITLHGGSISLDDTCTTGARFVICLPVGAMQPVSPEFAAP